MCGSCNSMVLLKGVFFTLSEGENLPKSLGALLNIKLLQKGLKKDEEYVIINLVKNVLFFQLLHD